MKERDFQSIFNHWVKNVYRKTSAFELKQTKTNSMPFSSVKEHQKKALYNVKHGIFVYKIVDCGYQNPFDCFSLYYSRAFVVIKFPSFFCVIDIDIWLEEEKTSNRKSLTSLRAKEIAAFIVANSS